MAAVITDRITKTPDVCGGKACIAGHRIRVMDIVIRQENVGMSADEILADFPQLNLSDVHAALAIILIMSAEQLRASFSSSSKPNCSMEQIRFYFDEHIPAAVAEGLRRRRVDVLTVQEAGRSGLSDPEQRALSRAVRDA